VARLCECGCGNPAPLAGRTNRAIGHARGQPTRFIWGHSSLARRPSDVGKRFWPKVEKSDGCWLWRAMVNPRGYGSFDVKMQDGKWRPRMAHRIAWELTNGPIPDGMFVCHHCDNPPCVRPDHLCLGTMRDNVRDMDAKGRRRTKAHAGEAHHATKLCDADVLEIRRLRKEQGLTYAKLGERFGVSLDMVWRVVTRKTWRHI
jgi:hypothetical protein